MRLPQQQQAARALPMQLHGANIKILGGYTYLKNKDNISLVLHL